MVGAVHPIQTLELLYALDRIGYTIRFVPAPLAKATKSA